MTTALPYLVGLMVALAVYLMLGRNIMRFLFGLIIISNAVNLLLFTCGRLTFSRPPLIPQGTDTLPAGAANALPQALILTAIVISFAMIAFVLVLFYRTYQTAGTLDSEHLRIAEPRKEAPRRAASRGD